MINLIENIFHGASTQFEGLLCIYLIYFGKTKIFELDFSNTSVRTVFYGLGTTFIAINFWGACFQILDPTIDNKMRLAMASLYTISLFFKYACYRDSKNKEGISEEVRKFYLKVFIAGILQILITLLFIR